MQWLQKDFAHYYVYQCIKFRIIWHYFRVIAEIHYYENKMQTSLKNKDSKTRRECP